MNETASITGWHAHVYFSEAELDRARAVCEAVGARFGTPVGRMHVAPVGPHPTGSCQITVPPEAFSDLIGWLALNRDGLDVFVHADTGNVMADHTQHVAWLGESQPLRLDVLRQLVEKH